MTLDKNYSTINKQTRVISVDANSLESPRLLVNIGTSQYGEGITNGDVIHFDTVSNLYVRSLANTPANAEVFGIVESINSDFSLNVITNGSIIYPLDRLINRSGTNPGGNDVYFLSGITAGLLENAGPTFQNHIIKSVFQKAPHGEYTGIVRNYIGYSNNALIQTSGNTSNLPDLFSPISFSDNMSKLILYNGFTEEFSIRDSSFSLPQLKFLTTETLKISKNSILISAGLDFVDYGNGVNYDARISNDGIHIVLFAKHTNKIYYLQVTTDPIDSSEILQLRDIINLDLTGAPEDKIWAVDDELTCMTVSSKALTRGPLSTDTKITSHDVSSRIQYFKRYVNSVRHSHKWRKIHENHAFGYCDSTPREVQGGCVDSLSVTSGIYRTSDIKVKGKNFSISTMCLIQDQILYNSKITGFHSPRYTAINKNATLHYMTAVLGITNDTVIFSSPTVIGTPFFGDAAFTTSILQDNPQRDLSSFKSYKCGFGMKNYRIHVKNNNYYYEDFSYRDVSGIEYFEAIENSGSFVTFPSYVRNNNNPYAGHSILASPQASIEASITKICPTANNIFCCFRYGAEIGVFKFPFLSNDGLTPFRYFEDNNSGNTVPNTSGFGLIHNDTATSILDFDFFATDNVFFICTPSKTLVSGTTQINTTNFNKAKFYTTTSHEFFKVDDKIFRFNSSGNNFQEISIGLS